MSATYFWSSRCAGQEQPQNPNCEVPGHAPPAPPNNYGYSVPGYYHNPPPTQFYPPQPTPTPGFYPQQPSQAKPYRGNGKHGNKGQQHIHDNKNKTHDNKGWGSGGFIIGNFGQQQDNEE